MNCNQEKNGTLSGLLILTVPAFHSIAILHPDWTQRSDQTARPAKAHRIESHLGLAFCNLIDGDPNGRE
jgi:hypothetical protein